MKKSSFLDVVDENDKVIGKTTWEEMNRKNLRVRSSAVLVFNSEGKLFVHKRSKNLPTHPGMYDVKLGGLVDSGETYKEAAERELWEEAGIENCKLEFLAKHSTANINREIYRTVYDGKMKLQEDEIESGRFMSMDEINDLKKEGKLSSPALGVLEEYLELKERGAV